MSIRLRLTLWYTALLGLVLAGFATLAYVAVARQLTSQLDQDIETRALQASRAIRAVSGGSRSPRADPVDLPATVGPADETLYVQIVNPRGEVLSRSPNLARPLPVPPESLRLALEGQEVHDTLSLDSERVELYSAPLLANGSVVGVLQVAAPLQPLELSLNQVRLALGAVVVLAIVLAALLGWLLATKALRSVDRMTQTARTIGRAADFSRRLPEPSQRDELGRLAATFNDMLGQLDQAYTTQRQFLADASHELRTPLTAIRTNVEALLRGGSADPSEREETLRSVGREADRMGRLLADLLALARADAGQPLERRAVAVDTLLLEVYQVSRQESAREGVQLAIGELEQVEVLGDPDRLKQLVLNLVDNALRYTPPGDRVTLDLVRHDGWAELRVRDTGVGIATEHLPRIFERFYRVDQPRSRNTGGTGLGLAISRWIAEAHGGRIQVESRQGLGSTFTVFLPSTDGTVGPSSSSAATSEASPPASLTPV